MARLPEEIRKDAGPLSCTVDFSAVHSWTVTKLLDQPGFRHGLPAVSDWFEVLPRHAYHDCHRSEMGRVRFRLVISLQPDRRRLRLAFHPSEENPHRPAVVEVSELELRQLWLPGIRDVFSARLGQEEVKNMTVELEVPQTVLRTGFKVAWKFHVRETLKPPATGEDRAERPGDLLADSPQPASTLTEDLSAILKSGKDSDVVITTEGAQRFSCHKLILTARSSIFSDMFAACDYDDGEIPIKDFGTDCVAEMVRFIYTDSCDIGDGGERTLEMMRLADKFDLPGLLSLCEQQLIRSMRVDNVGQLLILSRQVGAKQLEEITCDFVAVHYKRLDQEQKECLKMDVGAMAGVMEKMAFRTGS